MDWLDVEKRLCERVEDVCRHLLPRGKKEGNEWVCGDIDGRPGRSMKVNLTHNVGLWCDFAGSGGGKTLMSLWCAIRGQEFKICIREAKEFLGLPDNFDRRWQRPGAASAPATIPHGARNWMPLTDGCAVERYLVEVRKLDPMVVAVFGIAQTMDGKGIVYPYFPPAREEDEFLEDEPTVKREASWLKFELLERIDGKKREWTTTAPEKCLFGKPTIKKGAREISITEGEKDCMALATYGIPAVSVPFGAKWRSAVNASKPSPNREWIDRDLGWLENFETIYVVMDADGPGRKAAMDIIREIGLRRCRLVTLPEGMKDANECLMNGVTVEAMREAWHTAREFAPEKIKNALEFEREFFEDWFETALERGLLLSFQNFYRVRSGELSIWTGFGKHGKSKLLNQCCVEAMAAGERVGIASLEVRVRSTLKDISRQAWGGMIWDRRERPENPARTLEEEEREARANAWLTLNWLGKHLWLYDHVGIVHWRTLLDDFLYLLRRYGVRMFVIDSLMRCGIMEDDYPGQAQFITTAASFCQEHDVHMAIVAHRKKNEKGEKQGGAGDKSVVSGAAKITDNAHNIVEVWRDVDKGQKWSDLKEQLRTGSIKGEEYEKEAKKLRDKPDGKFIVRGQRDAEIQEGSRALWYMWRAFQFTDKKPDDPKFGPRRWVPTFEDEI